MKFPLVSYSLLAIWMMAAIIFVAGTDDEELVDREWSLVEYGDPKFLYTAVRNSRLTFNDATHRYTGSDGCNGIRGDYRAFGKRLLVYSMAAKQRGCPQPPSTMKQASIVKEVLMDMSTFDVDGDELRLTSSDGILIYRR